jgi:hypothetical protein
VTDHVVCPSCGGRGIVHIDQVADLTAADRARWVEQQAALLADMHAVADAVSLSRTGRLPAKQDRPDTTTPTRP